MEPQQSASSEKAPSAAAAAQMFMDLSQEYLEVVPDRRSAPIIAFGARSAEQRASLRDAILAVVLQRKFVTRGENTYMPGLLDRIYREHKYDIPQEQRWRFRDFQQAMVPALDQIAAVGVQLIDASGDRRSGLEQMNLLLNGRLLHSDYAKWERAGRHAFSGMTGTFLIQQRRLRDYLHLVRACMRDLHGWGVLSLTWEEPQEDIVEGPPGKTSMVSTFRRSGPDDG